MPDPGFGPEAFAIQIGVSRETLARLKAYGGLLEDWNSRHNLVSKSSLSDMWRRHFWDSAQLVPLIPAQASTVADLGSGAGFPGLVLAAMRPDLAVTLHDATAKKCAFLAAAAERMGVVVTIRNARIEDLPPAPFDVVTARALAPLPVLIGYAQKFLAPNGVCLFLKGQNVGSELTEAHKYWNMTASKIPSATDLSAAIVEVREPVRHDRTAAEKASHPGRRQPEGRRR